MRINTITGDKIFYSAQQLSALWAAHIQQSSALSTANTTTKHGFFSGLYAIGFVTVAGLLLVVKWPFFPGGILNGVSVKVPPGWH